MQLIIKKEDPKIKEEDKNLNEKVTQKKEEREKRYEQFFKFYELDWLKEENKELIRNYLDKCLEKNEKKLGTFTEAMLAEAAIAIYLRKNYLDKSKQNLLDKNTKNELLKTYKNLETIEKKLVEAIKKIDQIKKSFIYYYQVILDGLEEYDENFINILNEEYKKEKMQSLTSEGKFSDLSFPLNEIPYDEQFNSLYLSILKIQAKGEKLEKKEIAAILAFYQVMKEQNIIYKPNWMCLNGLYEGKLDCDLSTKLFQEVIAEVGLESKVIVIYEKKGKSPVDIHALCQLDSKEIYIETTGFLFYNDSQNIEIIVCDKDTIKKNYGKSFRTQEVLEILEDTYLFIRLEKEFLNRLQKELKKNKNKNNLDKKNLKNFMDIYNDNPITRTEKLYYTKIVERLEDLE
ncbi:MAG: hypothetical protein N3D10_03550 [Candidatus Micrarchaeota archaeon]|nr:hypothetical protein [Candidatus Micrarchaeota archaeon]